MKLNWDHEYLSGGQLREFTKHGETWLWEKLATFKPQIIFDVGCNVGEWSKMARKSCPNSEIHAFEILGNTFHKFYHNYQYDTNMYPNGFGLSDKEEIIHLKFANYNDRISTSLQNLRIDDHTLKSGFTRIGDDYVRENNITQIDFLKIDVEGMGHRVLKGLRTSLQNEIIAIIQFEYDRTAILERFLLIDYYELLTPYGFVIGKLQPGGIEFKEYNLFDEDFNAPDIIACHKSQIDIINALKR